MKTLKVLVLLSLVSLFAAPAPLFSETIYTKDGQEIKGAIAEETAQDEEMVWYEIESGDIIEYFGIERSKVVKILNDDGSTSKYSPTYRQESEKE